MRVTFQFWARGRETFQPIADLTTVTGRSFQGLVKPRAVWAGVPETFFKKSLLDLKLVALAAQVASGQPERVRSTLQQVFRHLWHSHAQK